MDSGHQSLLCSCVLCSGLTPKGPSPICQHRAGRKAVLPSCVGAGPGTGRPLRQLVLGERNLRADTSEPGTRSVPRPPLHLPGQRCPSRCQSPGHRNPTRAVLSVGGRGLQEGGRAREASLQEAADRAQRTHRRLPTMEGVTLLQGHAGEKHRKQGSQTLERARLGERPLPAFAASSPSWGFCFVVCF